MLKSFYRAFYMLFIAGVIFSLLGGTLFYLPFRFASVSVLDMAGLHKLDIESGDRKIDGICQWKDISEAWREKIRAAKTFKEYRELFNVPDVEIRQHGFIGEYVYEPTIKTMMYGLRFSLFMFSSSLLFIAFMLHLLYASLSLRRRAKPPKHRQI